MKKTTFLTTNNDVFKSEKSLTADGIVYGNINNGDVGREKCEATVKEYI
jgi:hypothetical protein